MEAGAMEQRDHCLNGNGVADEESCSGSGSGSGSGSEEGEGEDALRLEDADAPARALRALNALRKSRQHYDAVVVGADGGGEVPAHRAVLAAACPQLAGALGAGGGGPVQVQVVQVSADAESVRALVEYLYTGRLRARDSAAARRLYLAAWRLRVEPARALLAERLVRGARKHDCLEVRALPALGAEQLRLVDAVVAQHFDELLAGGALAALPLVRVELLSASSAHGGEESPEAVADAALAWLRLLYPDHVDLEEVCARTHLLYVDADGALRDCEALPAAGGDAPELRDYQREAAQRRARPPAPAPSPAPTPAERAPPRGDWTVLAARREAGVTRALLALSGRLAAARIAWRPIGAGVARGAPLANAREAGAGAARRPPMRHARAALGAVALDGRLVVCGGYDRAHALRAAEAYDPSANAWVALPDMRVARARFPAARLGRAVFALAGSDGHAELASVDVLEGGAWRGAAPLPLARSHAAAAADEARGRVYVVGGWAGGHSLRTVHEYRPESDTWVEAPSLRTGRSQCAAAAWQEAVWVLGGCDAWHCLSSTETLPLGAEGPGAWAPGPALPTARRSVGAAVWAGRLVSAGGSDGAASLKRVDWLEAPAGPWRPGPPLRRARAALALAVLENVMYAAGGFDGKEFLSCVECLYEPTGEWTTLCAPLGPCAPPAAPPAVDTPMDEGPPL